MTGRQGKILAVGAAGEFAGAVVPALASRGADVTGMVRHAGQMDGVLARGASDVVLGDLTDDASVRRALDGVDSAFYVPPAFISHEAQLGQRFVAAAVDAGVRRIVFLSVVHPVLSALVNHAAKAPVEEAILDSGLEYTFLHPTLYFQMLGRSFPQVVRTGVLAEPWSPATAFSRVDVRDIAEVAARALLDDDLVYGTFDLASPGWTNRDDVARLISEVTGTHVVAERLPDAATASAPEPLRTMFRHYDSHGLRANPLVLESVLGRPARTLRDYVTELHHQHDSAREDAS
ncbi:SDR family oxidoreductase [Aeromicrobium chenweiae]|uniref:Epimerase n=1 Tax=Aeromicrobium chenweiae TaxID=2079793 RepID=A0A2S0WS13_9ACTN|nr:NmrA family NAD(P)-binding protein [Aeromicrobium chenweiae]AWB94117.1 epimerase [Aeromicrobium chenweiae]TGN31413.1 NmrA/HSCARG family protein [Aeromicrobium chenweiae]